jgi:hypothetical protein
MTRSTLGLLGGALAMFLSSPAGAVVGAGQVAPPFTKSVLDSGYTRSLSEYRGRVVILFQLGYN